MIDGDQTKLKPTCICRIIIHGFLWLFKRFSMISYGCSSRALDDSSHCFSRLYKYMVSSHLFPKRVFNRGPT